MTVRPAIRTFLVALCLLLPVHAEGETFEFSYEPGKPLNYAMLVKMSMAMTMDMGEVAQATNEHPSASTASSAMPRARWNSIPSEVRSFTAGWMWMPTS